jgi:hypothetical protein
MIVVEDYTFTPGARGAGTIAIPEVIELENIQRIWNATRGALVYETTNAQYGIVAISVANGETTLTIETDTSTMNASDDLQILLYSQSSGGSLGSLSGPALDAFSRVRVSQGLTLADYKNVYDIDPEILADINGGSTGGLSHLSASSSILITGDVNSGDYTAAQTRMYHNYQPGKSQLALVSFNFIAAETDVDKRVGLFDANNGVFLHMTDAGGLFFTLRTDVSGSVINVPVARANWSVDPCDGTGPSGFDLDITKTQLLFFDFQWLGVGRVRAGFVHDGNFVVAHEFYHSNILTTPYWSQPSLPVRAEVRNETWAVEIPPIVLTTAPTMTLICATVLSEGGYLESGNDWSTASAIRSVGNAGVELPLVAIRLTNDINSIPNRETVRLNGLSVISLVSGVKIEVIRCTSQAAVTGGTWSSLAGYSGVEYNVTATGYSPALTDVIVDTFYVPAGQGQNAPGLTNIINPNSSRQGYIAQNIASNDSMAYLIFAESLGNNATASAAIQWREIS